MNPLLLLLLFIVCQCGLPVVESFHLQTPTTAATAAAASSSMTIAKKIKVEFEVDLPDGIDIPMNSLDFGEVQKLQDEAAAEYTGLLREAILSTLRELQDLTNREEIRQLQAWRLTASKEYKDAISGPYQELVKAVDTAIPEPLKNTKVFDNAKYVNQEIIAPTYQNILTKLTADDTYAPAKATNENILKGYNTFLTNTYHALLDAYPDSAIEQQKVNNDALSKGYNALITQVNQGLVQPTLSSAQEIVEATKETNQGLSGKYQEFATGIYAAVSTVADPVVQQSTAFFEATAAANRNIWVPQYNAVLTQLYRGGVEPAVQKAAQAVTTASTQTLQSIQTAQAEAVPAYNAWITETYLGLQQEVDATVGPALKDFATRLHGTLPNLKTQILATSVGISNGFQTVVSEATNDIVSRIDALISLQAQILASPPPDVGRLAQQLSSSSSPPIVVDPSTIFPTDAAQTWATTAAAQYQHFVLDAAITIRDIIVTASSSGGF